jgi:hypothetical protein
MPVMAVNPTEASFSDAGAPAHSWSAVRGSVPAAAARRPRLSGAR